MTCIDCTRGTCLLWCAHCLDHHPVVSMVTHCLKHKGTH